MVFDAIIFYPSAKWDKNSVYLEIENGFAFKLDMNDFYVETFNDQTFNQDGNDSATFNFCTESAGC